MSNMQWADRIGRRLKLRDLHVLSAVVQWGSMAKAAQHLAVSQPVVSAAIADLEHAIGVRLLDRCRRGVEPTIYGRALLKHGTVAFDALKQGVKEIEFLADPTAGELRIGCPEWIAAGLLPVIIDRMLQKHPRIVFHVDQTITAHAGFSRVARAKPGPCDGLVSVAVRRKKTCMQKSSIRTSGVSLPECAARGPDGEKLKFVELVNEVLAAFDAQCLAIGRVVRASGVKIASAQDHFIFLSSAQQFACHRAVFVGGSPLTVAVR